MKYTFIRLLVTLTIVTLLNGCFMPSFIHTQGIISVQPDQTNISCPDDNLPERFIVVSFWKYPTVNESKGKIKINDVSLLKNNKLTVDFRTQRYWVAWTPAMGTQHLAPKPGIMVLHETYHPAWNIGGTDSTTVMCCGKPKTKHKFEFTNFEETQLYKQKDIVFYHAFLEEKASLIKEIEKCKRITPQDKLIVLDKLEQIEKSLDK